MLRRSFLKNVALMVSGLYSIRAFGDTEFVTFGASRGTVRHLISQFNDVAGMRTIGRHLQQSTYPLRDAKQATDWIVNTGALDEADNWRIPINRRIREDFADGATVVVDGWVLSYTEACLCVLSTTL